MTSKISDKQKETVVILGAGPAGLAAGLTLARSGVRVVLVEKLSSVGGVSRTISTDGFKFDLGGHRWFTKDEALNEFVHDLVGDELIKCPRSSHIYFNGKYVRYPLKISDALKNMGFVKSIAAIFTFFTTKTKNVLFPREIRSMEDAYTAQFGPVLYETFFKGYSEKLWGLDCRELSGDWVAQRSKGMSIWQAIKDSIKKSDIASLIEEFEYPRDGIGRISDTMRDEIVRLGGEVLLEYEVIDFKLQGGKIKSAILWHDGHEQELGGDHFLCSLPLPLTLRLTNKTEDAQLASLAAKFQFRGLILVTIFLDKPQVTKDSWIYLQDERLVTTRLHEPDNWSSALVPEGKSSLVFEIGVFEKDEMWSRSDQELTQIVVNDLVNTLGFAREQEIIGSKVIREAHAYPIYKLDYKQDLQAANEHCSHFDNLTMIGRNGMFRYNNMDHSIDSGIKAAENLLGADHDLAGINADKEYQEIKRQN